MALTLKYIVTRKRDCSIDDTEEKTTSRLFLFMNKIQFFDLRGNIVRDVKVGENNAAPVNNGLGQLDYEKSVKYMLDMCNSDRDVVCYPVK